MWIAGGIKGLKGLNSPPFFCLQHRDGSIELLLHDRDRLVRLALLKRLTDTEDDADAGVECCARLLRDELGGFVEERAALGVAWRYMRLVFVLLSRK